MALQMKIPLSPWLFVVYCRCEGEVNGAIVGFCREEDLALLDDDSLAHFLDAVVTVRQRRRNLYRQFDNDTMMVDHKESTSIVASLNSKLVVDCWASIAALKEGFMRNQGQLLKAYGPKSLSLHNQYKICRSELISAISSRPFSNADDYHDTYPRRTMVQIPREQATQNIQR